MSIRIREVDGHLVALCAAKSEPKKGDIYLDDAVHEALKHKFARDDESFIWYTREYVVELSPYPDDLAKEIDMCIAKEETEKVID